MQHIGVVCNLQAQSVRVRASVALEILVDAFCGAFACSRILPVLWQGRKHVRCGVHVLLVLHNVWSCDADRVSLLLLKTYMKHCVK